MHQSKRKKYNPNTITDADELEKELERVRKEGFAVDNMEHEEGVRCVAAPIRDHRGRVFGALSISGPFIRITKRKIPEFAVKVKKVAEQISKELGLSIEVKKEDQRLE
ncbi:unnamed protein product [marine sediment metagenome]|uniref:IclR-ED domain-containing protein n=1 Tax=marine sediment metagenome TaxID=412755 RepID=X1IE23_9ZZZZ